MKFIDTNVLVYVADDADAAKQPVSREIVREALTTNGCLISAQVLNEFSSVLFKKLKRRRRRLMVSLR
jgi:predicted nucleic acid-binding protein